MHLHGISLQHFRNYTQQTFLFPKKTTIIVGNNAAGKTSIIEAVHLLSTGESFRAEQVAEMIQFKQEIGRVKGKFDETELEVTLTRGEIQGKKTQSRLYSVNQVRRLKKNFVGQFFTVAFRPEDMRLIEGSPSRRRQFIDTVLNVTQREYALSLKTYEEALKRRNRLLQQVQEGLMNKSVLAYWNSLILKHGQIVQEHRRQFFSFFPSVEFPMTFTIDYQPSLMNEERMAQYADREIAAGHTLIGPHKDDFIVRLAADPAIVTMAEDSILGSPVSLYGSRGQQRLAVLWLKMCELEYVKSFTNVQPILLLDDILSELDAEHRQDVFSLLHQGQAILTTTEEKMVEEITHVVSDYQIIRLTHD
jgi:DNA replication and repair protein RecF